jgi:histidinol-phosphate/aromatic aminotransferase/cobyric acid decarboxylase-like protein
VSVARRKAQPVGEGFAPYRWAAGADEVAARHGIPREAVLKFDQNTPPLPGVPQVPLAASMARLADYPDGSYRELREGAARAWLARNAGELGPEPQEDVLTRALAVIAQPRWAELFGPSALAEVPLAATVGGQVIAGTADRLLVEPDRVLVADFKTARRPPATLEEVPVATLRQMAAYSAALETIYPGRRIEAAVLYTQTPVLIAIPPELLAAVRSPPSSARNGSLFSEPRALATPNPLPTSHPIAPLIDIIAPASRALSLS